MFAHKYFSMSRQLPCKLAKVEVPKRIVLCDKITNWIFLTLNAIPPIVYGVSSVGFVTTLKHRNWKLHATYIKIQDISWWITMSLPLVSGIYLFTALYFIRKYKRNEVQINTKTMTLHATSFALYMASIFLFLYAYTAYSNHKISTKTYKGCLGSVYLS